MTLPLSLLPHFVYAADVSTRQEAIRGAVINERDYVSSWLSTLRNSWRMHGGKGETYFRILPGGVERRAGCDGMFLVIGPNYLKIMLFEAKVLKTRMDKLQNNRSADAIVQWGLGGPISHFSDQLARQAAWSAAHQDHAIVEMFIDMGPSGAAFPSPPFDANGSTCVRHGVARQHVTPPIVAAVPPQIPPAQRWHVSVVTKFAGLLVKLRDGHQMADWAK